MKLSAFSLFSCLLLGLMTAPVQAAIYICPENGQAVFSSVKTSPSCQESKMDGISEEMPSAAAASEVQVDPQSDTITQIWDNSELGSYDDVKILPTTRKPEADTKINVKLRNGTQDNKEASQIKKPRIPAPVIAPIVAVPKPKPQLTRKQILQNEIRNEQSALTRAQSRLEAAKKSGNSAAITQLQRAVNDREANIRAIRNEMR